MQSNLAQCYWDVVPSVIFLIDAVGSINMDLILREFTHTKVTVNILLTATKYLPDICTQVSEKPEITRGDNECVRFGL
jgi:hypothetical protein